MMMIMMMMNMIAIVIMMMIMMNMILITIVIRMTKARRSSARGFSAGTRSSSGQELFARLVSF